jgi:uncharacterized protein (TIGR00255 family)
MKSMTGFGRAAAPFAGHELSVQISSVNRRGIEIAVNLPDEWRELETAVGDRIRTVATRGRVSVSVSVRAPEGRAEGLPDDATLGRALDHLAAFAAKRGVPFAPDANLLWQVAASLRNNHDLPAAESAQPALLALVDQALGGFAAMRAREGATLQADMLARVALIRAHFDAIAARAPQVAAGYRENLLRRLRDAGLTIDLADERVLKEIALFADRCDIAEEITRARSHLDQLDSLLRADGEIGRKTEFLLQELGREVNTTGSKANDLVIAKLVIESKNELERIREQIANVE